MLEQFLYRCYIKAITRKTKMIDKQKIDITKTQLDAFVLFYFLLHIDSYATGVLKQSTNLDKSYKKLGFNRRRDKLFDAFLTILKRVKKDSLSVMISFSSLPANIKEAIYYDQDFDIKNDSFVVLLLKALDGNFFTIINQTCNQFYNKNEIMITVCDKYTKRGDVPTNRNIKGWNFHKAYSYDLFLEKQCEDSFIQSSEVKLDSVYNENIDMEKMKEALLFHDFIESKSIFIYDLMFNENAVSGNCGGLYLTQDFYIKRREFLSHYYNDSNKYISIIAYVYALPLRALKSLNWMGNVDFQDIESFLRRINSLQILGLKDAHNDLFSDSPSLPDYCSKGWKTIWHKPTIEEVLDEEKCDESKRFIQSWAIVSDDFNFNMGFTKYKGTVDDTITINTKYISKKDHENGKDKGFSEFYTNPDGKYGIAARKVFGNFLWGDFENEIISGWVCPRTRLTLLLYFMLLFVSPVCDILLLSGFIENDKVFTWLFLLGLPFPVIINLYILKYCALKIFELIDRFFDSFGRMIDKTIEWIVESYKKKVSDSLSIILKITCFSMISFLLLIYVFHFAYSLSISFVYSSIIVLYGYYCFVVKKRFVPIKNVPYNKYAIFFIIVSNMIFADEFFLRVFEFLYEIVYSNIIFITGLFVLLVTGLFSYKLLSNYLLNVHNYIRENDSLYNIEEKYFFITKVILFCMILFLSGESAIYFSVSDNAIDSVSFITIGVFLLLNLGLYKLLMFFAAKPIDVKNKRIIYTNSRVYGDNFSIKGLYIDAARNEWFKSQVDSKKTFEMIYSLVESISSFDEYKSTIFIKMDSNLLFELNCLKTRIGFRNFSRGIRNKLLESVIFNSKTANEAIVWHDKKVYYAEKFSSLILAIGNVFQVIYTPFGFIFKVFWAIKESIFDLCEFIIDKIHRVCPYSNISQKF